MHGPKAIESEMCVLGAAIIGGDASAPDAAGRANLVARLRPEHFSKTIHPRIWRAIVKCFREYGDFDIVAVKTTMQMDGGDWTDEYYAYLGELVDCVPNVSNAPIYAQQVIEAWARREVMAFSVAINAVAMNGFSPEKVLELTEKTREVVSSITPREEDYFKSALAEVRAIRKEGVDLSWGIRKIDTVMGGLRRRHLYTFGAKTSHCKTAFAMNVAAHNLSVGKRVLYNGFENLDQVPKRLAALKWGLCAEMFNKPNVCSEEEFRKIDEALQDVEKWKPNLVVLGGKSLAEMRKYIEEFKPDVVILDYIQRYATSHIHDEDGALVYAIGRAVSDLQDIAIRNNCAALCLSQFSRRTDMSSNRRPEISDLKGSGEIENMSDGIMLGWWRWKENPTNQKLDPEEYRVVVAKNKLGDTGDLFLKIDRETLSIGD